MFKESLPLVLFSILILWLVGSWGASFLPKIEIESITSAFQGSIIEETATPVNSPAPRPTNTPTLTPQPSRTPTRTPSPTATPTPFPSNTPPPPPIRVSPPTETPTPELAWLGRIVETTHTGAGTIGVRAAGLKDHPVVLRSGGWQSQPQLTGTKPELGDFSTEFGGLGPGEYGIELVNLSTITVTLTPGDFMLVEFRYDYVTPPSP